jgi:hypothetical protein
MKYLEWNNKIAEHFFNPENAGKDVYLFITKAEVISLGRSFFHGESDDEIWHSFILAIQKGLPGSQGNITSKAKDCFIRRGLIRIDNIPLDYRPYIGYLVFFVLPLIEDIDGTYSANNYYDRLNRFLKKNNIDQRLDLADFRNNNINSLWNDLEIWSNIKKSGDLGRFRVNEFANPNWTYVGKPFSQSILPPRAIVRLPELFHEAGMVPNMSYPADEIRSVLLKHGVKILGINSNVIELLRKHTSNELGESILETVNKEFEKWTGGTNLSPFISPEEKRKRQYIVAPLLLQFKLNENDGILDFSYRIYSSHDYPEDLEITGQKDLYERNGFSRKIDLPVRYTLSAFNLTDEYNKWIFKFPQKDPRIFLNAGYNQLSSNYWIEVDKIRKDDWMYLLASNKTQEKIVEWGKHFKEGNFLILTNEYDGIPDNHSLFKFRNPQESLSGIPILTIYTEKLIRFIGGLKLSFRSYLKAHAPKVYIENGEGHENILLQYKDRDEVIPLKKDCENKNIWILPTETDIDTDFYLRIEGEELDEYRQAYKLEDANYKLLSNEILPRKNKYDTPPSLNEYYIQGNFVSAKTVNTTVDGLSFHPINNTYSAKTPTSNRYCENILLTWLTAKRQCSIQEYNQSFETIFCNAFAYDTSRIQLNRIITLNLLDSLGFIDYDYTKNKITTLPPKLVLIPSNQGKKAILIGGRDEGLVKSILAISPNHNINTSIKTNTLKHQNLLIPDSIVLESHCALDIQKLALELGIEFDEWYIIKLKESIIPSIDEYEYFILENKLSISQVDHDWAKKVFNIKSLRFENLDNSSKSYSLVEYAYTTYWKEYGLWIDGNYYKIEDKNWGKYLVINHYSEKEEGYQKNTFFSKPKLIYRGNNSLYIPASLPLPRMMARMLLQASGQIPEFKEFSFDGIKRWYNVYHNVPSLLSDNFFRFKLKMKTEAI